MIGIWTNLIDLVKSEDLEDGATDDSIEDIARLRKVVVYLNGIFENIDPEITPFNYLTNLQKNSQACIDEINAYKGNKNTGHLTNANNHADSLLIQFQQIPASVYAVSEKNITESVSAYSKTIGSYISKYKEATEISVGAMANHIDAIEVEIKKKNYLKLVLSWKQLNKLFSSKHQSLIPNINRVRSLDLKSLKKKYHHILKELMKI